MSASPFFFIEVFNYKSGNWEKIDLYKVNSKGNYIPIDLWPWNGSHALFTVVGCENSYELPEFKAIHEGLPVNASPEMYSIFDKHCANVEKDGFDYVPEVKHFNLADAKLYLKDHLNVQDFDAMEEYWYKNEDVPFEDVPKIEMTNPLYGLVDRVETILDLWDDFWFFDHSYSDVRIIYWVSQ